MKASDTLLPPKMISTNQVEWAEAEAEEGAEAMGQEEAEARETASSAKSQVTWPETALKTKVAWGEAGEETVRATTATRWDISQENVQNLQSETDPIALTTMDLATNAKE